MNTEDKKYYIRNEESGEYDEVTKRQYDRYHNSIAHFRPKINGLKGRVLVFGTGDNLDNGSCDFKSLFTESKTTPAK